MADGVAGNDYSDSNRAFLQAFMARSTMTFAEAKPVLAAIFSAHEGQPVSADDVTEEDLHSYINAANTAISPFDLEIRSTLPQLRLDQQENESTPSERVYALVNTTSDPVMQLATTYTADEIAFIKRILDAIFDTNNTRRSEAMVVSGIQAIQLAKASTDSTRRVSGAATQQTQGGAAQSLTMSQAEMVLKQLVEDGWFEKSRKGNYSLSPRGLMELRGWLVATYNENDEGARVDKIKFCAACRDIITVGQRCENRDCLGRLHDMCTRNFFRMRQAEQCPVCKAPWSGEKFVGERAITSMNNRSVQNNRRMTNTQRESDIGPSTQVTSLAEDGDESDILSSIHCRRKHFQTTAMTLRLAGAHERAEGHVPYSSDA
ncbi:non-structural maintenance of chromosomes element 1 family protein [Aspergillus clavatus NRRL 1]|uniref:Non-structural maintenance of chromosomes element 1 homolog n=1 Tax=Aspergillus clavatus (strain ATCC 1007 / CBS 513.65 / DSM 816 / NCTC 3887 / NRRL 1 / QM 1276 / 107) TaxID=344612 RepID=A1CCH2_ASPCL|nr:DNA repair protein Nse1, putative [Aspergillus clavatus NRRL 1]EAW12229.1 DNA repair protein Nse1, putative [Aspergillus clavatus NRRL 1]